MIYLIGGPPKCGKTTLSKNLSKKLGIPWVSTDALQNTVKPYVPEEEWPEKFPSSSRFYESNDEKYDTHPPEKIISAYRTQARTLGPGIDEFVFSEIRDGNEYIVEGLHLEPKLIRELVEKYPGEVTGVIVFKTDIEKFLANLSKSTTPNDWVLTKTRKKSTFRKIAKMVVEYSKQIEADTIKYGIKYFNLDDFDEEHKEVEDYIVSESTY